MKVNLDVLRRMGAQTVGERLNERKDRGRCEDQGGVRPGRGEDTCEGRESVKSSSHHEGMVRDLRRKNWERDRGGLLEKY